MNDIENYDTFIKEEIIKIEKDTKFIWGGGIAMIAFLVLYLLFLFNMTSFITKPENAAYLVANSVKENLPEFLNEAEATLSSRSIKIAEQTSQTFLQLIPEMRETAETQIDFTHKELIPQISWEFQQILTNYIRDHEQEIRAFATVDNRSEFPQNFVDELMDQFGTYLNKEMAENYGGRDLEYLKENSLLALQAMNEYQLTLKEKPASDMARKERLQRRILASVTRRLIEVPR